MGLGLALLGLLIEIVEPREGMRGRRRGSPKPCAFCERFGGPVMGPSARADNSGACSRGVGVEGRGLG